jgi:nucleoside phosphorylase/tetratricopeptide (TPR) repeat protein
MVAPGSLADLLLVTVNDHETNAVRSGFEAVTGVAAKPITIGDRTYWDLGLINGTRVFHALSEAGSGGLGAAQQTVEKALKAIEPHAVIAIGVAFGVDPGKQKIGDVLLSRQLWLYEVVRVGTSEIVPRGDKPHASTALINYFKGFAGTWKKAEARLGTILSGEKLVDDVDYRNSLLKLQSEAIGGEMEGGGLYAAAHDHKTDWFIMKGICDWADGNKSHNKDARQKEAAHNAVSFLLHALQQAQLPRVKPPQSKGFALGSAIVAVMACIASGLGWLFKPAEKNPVATSRDTIQVLQGGVYQHIEGIDTATLGKIMDHNQKLMSEYESRLETSEGEKARLREALASAMHQLEERAKHDADAKDALSEIQRTGDLAKLQAMLAGIAERFRAEWTTHPDKYLKLCRDIAAVAYLHGDLNAAAKSLAIVVAADQKDLDSLVLLSRVYFLQGNLLKAEELLRELAARATPDKPTTGSVFTNLAVIAQHRGEVEHVQEWYDKALTFYTQTNNVWGQAAVKLNVGNLRRTQGDLNGAENSYREALRLNETLGRKEGVANCYSNIGSIRMMKGDLVTADSMFRKSLEINMDLRRSEGIAIAQNNLGQLAIRRGDFADAEERFTAALKLADGGGIISGQIGALRGLGRSAFFKSDFHKADSLLRQALGLAIKSQDAEEEAACSMALSEVLIKEDRLSECRPLWESSLRILERIGPAEDVERCRLLLKMSDEEQHKAK